jgi:hypothetical protein
VIVFLQDDVNRVISRRKEAKNRDTDPAKQGEWLTDELFQVTRDIPEAFLHAKDVLCIETKLAEEAGVSPAMPSHWRRHRHPALDPAVNGGRLRFLRVPKRRRPMSGPGMVRVSSRDDWKKIVGWRGRQQQQAATQPRGLTREGLAQTFDVDLSNRDDGIALSAVLNEFRKERPSHVFQASRWHEAKNRFFQEERYDEDAVRQFLGGQTVQAVAANLRRATSPDASGRLAGRLQKARAFLLFVLMEGRWAPSAFEHFQTQLAAGTTIKPSEGACLQDVRRWAKKARVNWRQVLAAKATLPIGLVKKGLQKSASKLWRLTEPVVIPLASPHGEGTNGQPASNGTPPAPPASEDRDRPAAANRPTKKNRGPVPKLSEADIALHDEWVRAHEVGVRMKDFARDKDMTLKELKRILSRVRMDRFRKQSAGNN